MGAQGFELRKQFYEMMRRQAENRLGVPPVELQKYQKVYESEMKGKWEGAEVDELMSSILQANLLLLGDFHGLGQSQKSHLRILKKLNPIGVGLSWGLNVSKSKTPLGSINI